MSTEFHNVREVRAQTPKRCDHCWKNIEAGELHLYTAVKFEGDFSAYREHFECNAAWTELNFDRRGLHTGEGAAFLADDDHEQDDREWMVEKHPIVAERLGWRAERRAS